MQSPGMSVLLHQVIDMGRCVEESIQRSVAGIFDGGQTTVEAVFSAEESINRLHTAVQGACLDLLDEGDLDQAGHRMILSLIRISNDLERMGDHAVNICEQLDGEITWPRGMSMATIPQLAVEVQMRVRQALQAWIEEDVTSAREILEKEPVIDDLEAKAIEILIDEIRRDQTHVRAALALVLIAKNLERLGDHATNIAEDVIWVHTGKDVRHRGGLPETLHA